ncbi:Flavonoid 3'-hydroxylase [Heracleum sosnowskyi]|uniref:Flavonoid 3'-hydroxylase n=1 Tax=Heracleum sosnowskyi TaxID=360622 RepID=A0AAD8MVM7_9APIA|nr:Flavonoid 3'-hydroxylase [Heracleum sosnowskyi]
MVPTLPPLVLYTSIVALVIYCLLNLRTLLFNRHSSHNPLPPGPKPWPIIGNLPHLGTIPHHSLAAMAQTYGPLMHLRLGFVHVVVACSADVAAQFLKTHDSKFSNRPPNSGAKHVAYNYQDLVFAPYGPRWRMLRKICAVHLFSAKALDDFRHVRQEEVGVLVRGLAGAGEKAAPLGQFLNVCATNALGRVMLGKRVFSYGTSAGAGDPKADEFKDMVVELMTLAGVFNFGDFIPALEPLDLQGVAKKMKKLHARFDSFLNQILEEHQISGSHGGDAGNSNNVDLLSTLLSLKDVVDSEGGKLNDTEIKALLLNLFTAGTDTTSSTVEWAIAEVLRNPKVLAQARKELDSVIGPDQDGLEVENLNMDEAYGLTLQRAVPLMVHPSPRLAQQVYDA